MQEVIKNQSLLILLLYLGFLYLQVLFSQLRWYHPVQLLLPLLVSLQYFYTFIIIYFHLLIIAEGTSVVGVVLGAAAAAAATIVLFLCVILAILLCVQRRRKGIVHTPACVHVFEVTSDRQFTIMLIFQVI